MLSHLKKYEILLASNSPRRRELLAGLDIDYRVTALPEVDESYPDTSQNAFGFPEDRENKRNASRHHRRWCD